MAQKAGHLADCFTCPTAHSMPKVWCDCTKWSPPNWPVPTTRLLEKAKIPEDVTLKWLKKRAIWQIYSPTSWHIQCPQSVMWLHQVKFTKLTCFNNKVTGRGEDFWRCDSEMAQEAGHLADLFTYPMAHSMSKVWCDCTKWSPLTCFNHKVTGRG